MSFVDRPYPELVRDVLTTLTHGVTREVHRVDYDPDARPVRVPDIALARRPVRRVSFVGGFVTNSDPAGEPIPATFSLQDYELVAGEDDPDSLAAIRFLPFGRRPAPGTDVTVNYYPRDVEPTVLDDVNVGSVTRTIVEAISRELALVYELLDRAYDSAFVDTAEGSSLDRVVRLLGLERFKSGRPVGTVRFSRRAGSVGSITIPAGIPITDAPDKVRYETIASHTMLAGETTAEVRVRGAEPLTPPVESGVLTVIQRSIAGIDRVTNERPTTRASAAETDDELRTRARGSLLSAQRGTVEALRFGLLQLPEVREVTVTEMPNGVPGEVALAISPVEPGTPLSGAVFRRIEEIRPAGIRVIAASAPSVSLEVGVDLVLAGTHLGEVERRTLEREVKTRIVERILATGVGKTIRTGPIVAQLLQDARIVDATLHLSDGASPPTPGADWSLPAGHGVETDAERIAILSVEFADEATGAGSPERVEVRAVIGATPVTGSTAADVKSELERRLKSFFAQASVGTSIDFESLLAALRHESVYSIDPLATTVTLSAGEQFVQLVSGGTSFTVSEGQTFEVVETEVST